jgi:hypothetical protein
VNNWDAVTSLKEWTACRDRLRRENERSSYSPIELKDDQFVPEIPCIVMHEYVYNSRHQDYELHFRFITRQELREFVETCRRMDIADRLRGKDTDAGR